MATTLKSNLVTIRILKASSLDTAITLAGLHPRCASTVTNYFAGMQLKCSSTEGWKGSVHTGTREAMEKNEVDLYDKEYHQFYITK